MKPAEIFTATILDDFWDHFDWDACDIQDIALDAGLLCETKATKRDAKQDHCQEYGIEEGDTLYKFTPEAKRIFRNFERRKPK